jgi:hypothetical protein
MNPGCLTDSRVFRFLRIEDYRTVEKEARSRVGAEAYTKSRSVAKTT